MAFEINKYNLLYGKVLSAVKNDVETAKSITPSLYKLGADLNLSYDRLLGMLGENGLNYRDQLIIDQLNRSRSASSQLGFIEITDSE